MGNGSMLSQREAEENRLIRAFLFDLIDPDVYGYQCSSDVQDKARSLLGLPALPPYTITEAG